MAQSKTAKTASKRSGQSRPATRSGKAKAKTARPKRSAKSRAGDEEVTIDRRRANRRQKADSDLEQSEPKLERRQKVNRRRQIDPTTCERDYTDQEIEFMNAIDEYKRTSGRMFPTCSEVLEVVRSLGYVKAAPTNPQGTPDAHSDTAPWVASAALGEDELLENDTIQDSAV